jgi:hypothetical protein
METRIPPRASQHMYQTSTQHTTEGRSEGLEQKAEPTTQVQQYSALYWTLVVLGALIMLMIIEFCHIELCQWHMSGC